MMGRQGQSPRDNQKRLSERERATRAARGNGAPAPRPARGTLSTSSLDWARDDPELAEGSKGARERVGGAGGAKPPGKK